MAVSFIAAEREKAILQEWIIFCRGWMNEAELRRRSVCVFLKKMLYKSRWEPVFTCFFAALFGQI